MQPQHQTQKYWPVPLNQGVLVEIEYGVVETKVALINGNMRNLPTARVRAVSPFLPDAIRTMLMPDGDTPGGVGIRVLISEANLDWLVEAEYEAAGLTFPSTENRLGDLAFISFDKIISTFPDDMSDLPPFGQPLGSRIFFEFDFDDASDKEVTLESGLIVQEKTLAAENQLATVIAVGPNAQFISVGDRIIAPMQTGSVLYEGEEYPYVDKEHEIISVLRTGVKAE